MTSEERDRLHTDLARHIGEKLDRWVADSYDLYDMAELPELWAQHAMTRHLLRQLGNRLSGAAAMMR